MIDKLTYEQVEEIVKGLREQNEIIIKLLQGRSLQELNDFTDAVEVYCKFLESTVELNRDADLAIKDMVG